MTLSFWLILLAVLSYGLLHSILASLKVKAWASRRFGSKADRWYRLVYNFIAVFTLLPILGLPLLLNDKELYQIHSPWLYLTLLIQILAVILLIISVKQMGILSFLGLRQLWLPEDTSPPRLISDGLYRYVRHPQYTAGLVFIWLLPLMTWNLLALNIGITLYIFVGMYIEEKKSLREFGEAYVEYQRKVPILIPGLRKPSRLTHSRD